MLYEVITFWPISTPRPGPTSEGWSPLLPAPSSLPARTILKRSPGPTGGTGHCFTTSPTLKRKAGVPDARHQRHVGGKAPRITSYNVCYTKLLRFKYGTREREKEGLHITDMDEAGLSILVNEIKGLHILKVWKTDDTRADRKGKWLNVILKKI